MNVMSMDGKTIRVKGDAVRIIQANNRFSINGKKIKLDKSKKVQTFVVKGKRIFEEIDNELIEVE